MAAAEADENARPRKFPALDPEPPPRSWWRRLLVPGALLVAAALVLAAVELWPVSSSRAPAPAAAPPLPSAASHGHIVVQTPNGYLALADPGGGHYTKLTVRGLVPAGQIPVLRATDGRYLTTLGQVVAIGSGRPTAAEDTSIDISKMSPAEQGPFADHDRALVALDTYNGESSATPIVVYNLAGGAQTPLGSGDFAAGDPAALGVFTSVAAPVRASATVPDPSLHSDARIELRDAGRRPAVLATARALSLVLGLDPGLQVELVPYPDPAGDKVAVQVDLIDGSETGGVVVLSRSGRVLGSASLAFGPVVGEPVAWSPDGRSLAYTNTGTGETVLITWRIGAQPVSAPFPRAGYGYGRCLWSPDASAVLCAAYRLGVTSPQSPQKWALARVRGGPMAMVAARGTPLAWLPSAGGR